MEPMTPPSIAAVVVTRNRLPLLVRCVDALRAQPGLGTIYIADNGSTDGTAEWLAAQSGLRTLSGPNEGSAGGYARGLRAACTDGAEWIWCLDDDLLVEPGALDEFRRARDLQPGAGFFCGRITLPDGRPDNRPVPLPGGREENGLLPVWAATFTSLLVSARAVRTVGLPLRDFFIWSDDIEFTSRISARFPGYLVPSSRAVHHRTAPAGLEAETDPARIDLHVHQFRNRIHLLRTRPLWFGLRALARTIWTAVAISFSPLPVRKWRVMWRGLRAGFSFHPRIEFPEP
jgi:GT2 family glycosyltransferase